MLAFVIAQGADGRAASGEENDDEADDVQPGVQADADVAQFPDIARAANRAVSDREHRAQFDDEGHVAFPAEFAREVEDVGFGDVVVGEDSGEGEEEGGDADQYRAALAENARHRVLGEGGGAGVGVDDRAACVFQVGDEVLRGISGEALVGDDVVLLRHQDDERGRGTDEQGVDIDGKRLHQPLLHRMLDCGGGSGVRARALSGFVGVNAALDAHADGCAETGGGAEGIADDEREQLRHAVDIDEDDDHRQHDVGQRHERHHHLREIGDAADAAEDDEGEQHQHAGGSDEAVRADRTGDAGRYRLPLAEDLHHGAGNAVRLRAN